MQHAPVVVTTSAYGADLVRARGQGHFVPIVAGAGASGIEIRRELFTSSERSLSELGEAIAGRSMFAIYSAPVDIWTEDGGLARSGLDDVFAEAAELRARFVKVTLGHFGPACDLPGLAKLCARAPMPLMVENDQTEYGGQVQPIALFMAACRAIGCQVGMTFDIGNWRWTGTNPMAAAAALAPYVGYVHCKGVENDFGKLRAVALAEEDADWRALFTHFPQRVLRGIEFPLVGADLEAVSRRFVRLLAAM